MSNGSPTAYLLWAVLSTIFFLFLLAHLWLYDRFDCVKWHSGRQPGTFRRVMTYSYLATVPLLVIFSITMTTIKFQEGYFVDPPFYTPRPVLLWSPAHRRWLFPLNLLLSMAWAFEMVTHLEELAFWLFLLHQCPEKHEWFESWEYKAWGLGSTIAIMGLPLTAVISRNDIERTQAWIFFVGSLASSATTISFLYILFKFPLFIQQVKQGGAAPDVVVRLATFYNLNRIRVIFRFLFTGPLLTIGLDAFFPPYRVIMNPFALDFLLILSGIGCFVSSAITLFVFFPRSMTQEAGYTTMDSPAKTPALTLPKYYHEQDLQQEAYPQDHHHEYPMSGSKQSLSPSSPTYHPGTDHRPTGDEIPGALGRSSHELHRDEWVRRGSAELPIEGEAMVTSSVYDPDVSHPERQESQPAEHSPWPSENFDSAITAVWQPIWRDTLVEVQEHQQPDVGCTTTLEGAAVIPQSQSSVRLRPHSDAPFDSRRVVFPSGIFEDSRQSSNERRPNHGGIEKRAHRTGSGPVVHPYLMSFTSPIDLLDTLPSDSQSSRMV